MNKKFRVYAIVSSHIDESLRQISYPLANGRQYYASDFDTQKEAEIFLEIQEEKGYLQGIFTILPIYQLEVG